MGRSEQRTFGPLEVKTVHQPSKPSEPVVKEVHREGKRGMGAVIRAAIGPDKLEAYGHPGLVSGVCSGEKVPDYLAAIYDNDRARLRMAKALLRKSGKRVKERTVFEIDEYDEQVG